MFQILRDVEVDVEWTVLPVPVRTLSIDRTVHFQRQLDDVKKLVAFVK